MSRMKTVYEVVYYDGRHSGAAGDCTHVARFRSKAGAERFADGKECYGKPATVETAEVPASLADRWAYLG